MKYLFLLMLPLTMSCDFTFRKTDERVNALNEMQQSDVDFSNLAKDKGFRKAFLEYIEEDGVLLRDNHMPIIGADAIEYISSINDSTFSMVWEPQGGDVSESGDLGFTYGLYVLSTDSTEQKGSYVTVWRRQKDGKWKFLLDAGTQGLGEAVKE